MIPTKELTPHVPVEVNEIIEQVLEAYSFGITKVHIHARETVSLLINLRSMKG